jgi:bifunctional UDP-N-acetylglucosamine pyrophosphorylase / glucosamine-1-phosphate N-acetyltransferase
MEALNIIILAAGKGTRMNSSKPKVLHEVGNKPILKHVLDCATLLKPNKIIVVYGFGGDKVKEQFSDEGVVWVEQIEQKGTGHAVQQAITSIDEKGKTLVLLGDVPLINADACKRLVQIADRGLGIMSFIKNDPTGYGRLVRNVNGAVIAIVEHKDANEVQLKINEVNTGIMAMPNHYLKKWLSQLTNNNAQKEYYLTDIVGFASNENVAIETFVNNDEWSVTGINSKVDLAQIERIYQLREALSLMQHGVTLKDPNRIEIRGHLSCGKDVEIDVNCVFEGNVIIEDNVNIGPNCYIKNANIKSGSKISAYTHIDGAQVGETNSIGPFARLRPGTILEKNVHIGNFVELKNTVVADASKINHLSYVGDAVVGSRVNIGAGTITCNYDGANKFKTIIEDDVFVGSDTQLIAPITLGKGSTIAAGSTITKNVPAESLTLCRARDQKSVMGWKRPQKVKK